MNANALHAVRSSAAQQEIAEPVTQIKALDSHFESFGDALFSWVNSTGFEAPSDKCADGTMVYAFCRALKIPYGKYTTELEPAQYFESDAWFFKFAEEHGFFRQGRGEFFKLDEHNRPIGFLAIGTKTEVNIVAEFLGDEALLRLFREAAQANIKIDPTTEKKSTYVEVISTDGMMLRGGPSLTYNMGTIENKRIALPEFYPYLDGGPDALLRDFLESEESVLILKGPPGTGKTSLVSSGIDLLNLLPIYAKRAEVISNKDFISFVFKTSDDYMAKVAGTAAKARNDLFRETLVKEREYWYAKNASESEEAEQRIPVIVVEDGDLLLAPREQGNDRMPGLLNETDGVGSNHTRKIIFTVNLANLNDIDSALIRPGRCYDVVECRLLTPDEAVAARAAAGLPEFEKMPTRDISLAEALRKPRKKIVTSKGKATLGFN